MRQDAFRVLLTGTFREGDVRVAWDETPFPFPADLRRLIEETWAREQARAQAAGQVLFPGPMCGLRGWVHADGQLRLDLRRTDYREFVGTNRNLGTVLPRFGGDALVNGIGVNAAAVTGDGFLVLLRKSQRVFDRPGMLDVPSGGINPVEHRVDGIPDVFYAMRDELAAEVGLGQDNIGEVLCLGLVEDCEFAKPELIFKTSLGPPRSILEARWAHAREGFESSGLVFIENTANALRSFLDSAWAELTPGAQASLTLHAAHRGFWLPA